VASWIVVVEEAFRSVFGPNDPTPFEMPGGSAQTGFTAVLTVNTKPTHRGGVYRKREEIWSNRRRGLALRLGMIFCEDRCTVFRIMP
jgi:hypothetical protein